MSAVTLFLPETFFCCISETIEFQAINVQLERWIVFAPFNWINLINSDYVDWQRHLHICLQDSSHQSITKSTVAAVEWETFLAWMIELRRCGPLDMVATSEEVRKTNLQIYIFFLESHRSWKDYFVSHEWKVWQGVNKWAQFSKLAVPEKVKTDSFAWRRRWTRCESPSFRAMVSSSLLHGSRLLKNARPLRFAVGENPGICSEAVLAFWWKRTWEPKSGRLISKLCWLKSG